MSFAPSYGEFDSTRVVRSNRRLAALLKSHEAPVSRHVEKGLDHFDVHSRCTIRTVIGIEHWKR